MADYVSESVSWYRWLADVGFLPGESHYIIRVISSFFITLALAPIIPIILLVVYDLVLWFWRLSVASLRERYAQVVSVAEIRPPPPRINDTA